MGASWAPMGAEWAPMGAHGGPWGPMGRIIIALYNTCQLATCDIEIKDLVPWGNCAIFGHFLRFYWKYLKKFAYFSLFVLFFNNFKSIFMFVVRICSAKIYHGLFWTTTRWSTWIFWKKVFVEALGASLYKNMKFVFKKVRLGKWFGGWVGWVVGGKQNCHRILCIF